MKWGVLFEEFKNNKGFISTQFYFIFMIRRMLYGFSQVFLNSQAEAQNALNIFGTFITLFYLFRYLCHKEKGVLICEIVGEIAILVAMILSLIFLFDFSEDTKEITETIIMVVVFVCILIQITVCIFVAILGFKEKFISKKKAATVTPSYGIKSDGGLVIDTSVVYTCNHDISSKEKQKK